MTLTEARILVVEDEPALREMFAKWLRAVGCPQVRSACNGQEALEQIRSAPIDVLISDVRMPVMDGQDLVRQLYLMKMQVACIIFVSGFADIDRREMYHMGVEAFLPKPFRLEELSTLVERAIADRARLWQAPMEIAPRQSVRLELRGAAQDGLSPPPDGVCSEPDRLLHLGRGGFSAWSAEAVGSGEHRLPLPLPGEPP